MINENAENTNAVNNIRAKLAGVRNNNVNKDAVADLKFRFEGETVRRIGSAARDREDAAIAFVLARKKAKKGSPTLGDLFVKTAYNIEDLRWDIARGRIVLEPK